jgi:hypothetical protein
MLEGTGGAGMGIAQFFIPKTERKENRQCQNMDLLQIKLEQE